MTDPVDGERLRRAWGALADDGGPAVDDDAIWRAARGESSPEERRAVVDAVASNPAAAESWRLATELQRDLETVPAAIPARPRRLWVGWATAAALLLAVVGFWPDTPDTPVYRDPGSGTATVSEITNLISETEPLPRHAAVLRWSAPDAAERFTLRVLTSTLEPLLVLNDLTTPEAQLPSAELSEVPDGVRLLWQVEARTPDGGVITSKTFFFELTTDPSHDPEPSVPRPE